MGKIVIVDDAPEAIRLMASYLRQGNHEVVGFQTGVGLEDRIKEEQPDVLLLDIVMPERNGYQVLRSLKKDADTRNLPVILVSSKNQATDVSWGKAQGATDYVTKPFTAEQLLTAVAPFAG